MAVTPKPGSSPTSNRAQQFGTMARDSNHQPLGRDNYPYYQDATASPVKSPVALTTTPQLIKVPAAAVSMVIIGAVAIRVSDTVDNSAGYMGVPANTSIEIPVVSPGNDPNNTTGQLWLTAESGTGNCSFYFKCV